MSRLLFLAAGDINGYIDLNRRSILHGLPGRVTVLANEITGRAFAGLPVELHTVRWHDFSAIEAQVVQLHAKQPFTSVATIDERLMELAARLRDVLDVPGLRSEQIPRFRHKPTMKHVLGAAGVRVPEFTHCEDRAGVDALLARYGRIVLKPIDGMGSWGVSFADSEDDVANWYTDHSEELEKYEAEEYINGPMYHVNAVVHRGRAVHTSASPYLPGFAPIDFSVGAPLASLVLDDSPLRRKLIAFSDRAIEVLGLQDGVTHLECFVTPNEEIIFCEIAARPAAGGIVRMIEAQSGINYGRAAVLLAVGMGGDIPLVSSLSTDTVGMLGFRVPDATMVQRIAQPDAFTDPWIRYTRIDGQAGALVAGAAHCTDFVGLFVFSGKDSAEFQLHMSELRARFDREFQFSSM